MVMLLLWRGLFLVVYRSYFTAVSWREMITVFLVGFRFDLSTTLLTISLPFLSCWLPWPLRIRSKVIVFASWFTAIALVVATGFLWSDLLFYGESGHHLTIEPAGVYQDLGPMLMLVLTEYPFAFMGLIVLLILIVKVICLQFRPLLRETPNGWWSSLGTLLVVTAVTVLGIRGGWQKEPLKSSDAVMTNSTIAGNLSLNGWYSFLATMFLESRPPRFSLPDSVAFAATREMIASSRDRFESDQYPLLRVSRPAISVADSGEPLNVVLLVIESLNASYLQSHGGTVSAMPFLDSLAESSLIFTNCTAVGTRSFRGLCAILASVPNLGGNPYGITFTLPRLRGMGDLFGELGYQIRFMHAAAPGSMGVMAIARMAGYQKFVSAADFPGSAQNGSWGVWDHLALMRMSQEMDSMAEPLHYGIFTLCTHAPWALPRGFSAPFHPSTPNAEILNTFAYLDSALQEFFTRESSRARFKRTLYVIVGDHTTHASEEERFRVGCVFHAPERLKPAVDNRLMSHLDILPTILDLTGVNASHSCFGRSMLDPDTIQKFAVMTQSNLVEWQRGDRVLVSDIKKDVALFSLHGERTNLLAKEPAVVDSMRRELQAYYQTAERLIRNNLIYPARGTEPKNPRTSGQ